MVWRLRSTTHITSLTPRDGRVGDRFPADALIELCVTDERDLTPAASTAGYGEVSQHVPPRAMAPQTGAVAPRPTEPVE
jgi:hypothetical protein